MTTTAAFEANDRHARKIERLVASLRSRKSHSPLSIQKKAIAHQVPKSEDRAYSDEKIDVRDLDEILEIDVEGRTCTAEPGVTFERLVQATLPHGLVPIIVPELRTITIGGAVAGCSLESASFKYGGFHDTCVAYEVVTARGDVIDAQPDNDERLVFQMMHGSFGTLGLLTKLKFKLLPAKPFVKVRYERYETLEAYKKAVFRHFVEKDVDFMDGIIFSPTELVLSLGELVDTAPYAHRYDWTKVYYSTTRTRSCDYLRTIDYFFRYDHGVTNVHPKSALGRLLFGRFMHSDRLLRLAKTMRGFLKTDRPRVTVDLFIPFSKVDEFLSWYGDHVGFFPLWCVPYRLAHRYEWIEPTLLRTIDDELFLDLAIYGMKQPRGRNVYQEIEGELLRVHGIKTLISYNYYDEKTFWRMFNRDAFTAVKRRTDPENVFRDLYSKTCRAPLGLDDVPHRFA